MQNQDQTPSPGTGGNGDHDTRNPLPEDPGSPFWQSPDDTGAQAGAGWSPALPGSRRKALVPRWVWISAAAVLGVIVLGIAVGLLVAQTNTVRVPSLKGLDQAAASAKLHELGLVLKIGDRRFSANASVNTVVDQTPPAGTKVGEGTVVTVALSAGSESFVMPDVVGSQLVLARKQLQDRGLVITVEEQSSDRPSGTVLASFPTAGTTVSTGDSVRLTVASLSASGTVTLPSDLTGMSFVIDPEPMPSGSATDTVIDVARKLEALLVASNATVVVTRQVMDAGVAVSTEARLAKARESSATAIIGLVVSSSGMPGITVLTVPNTPETQAFYLKSAALGTAMLDALRPSFSTVQSAAAANDGVLTSGGTTAIRVRLGSSADAADRNQFADPQWSDNIARGIYQGITAVFGPK